MKQDVLVFDSTSAGIFAAIAATRAGATATLLTEDRHVGGLQTSGLGNTNAGERAVIGGIVREFHDRVRTYYATTYGDESDLRRRPGRHPLPSSKTMACCWMRGFR